MQMTAYEYELEMRRRDYIRQREYEERMRMGPPPSVFWNPLEQALGQQSQQYVPTANNKKQKLVLLTKP